MVVMEMIGVLSVSKKGVDKTFMRICILNEATASNVAVVIIVIGIGTTLME